MAAYNVQPLRQERGGHLYHQTGGRHLEERGAVPQVCQGAGIKPIDDIIKRMGISDEDLENLTSEMMSAFGGAEGMEGLMNQPKEEGDEEDDGRTATFPFLNQLFGGGATPAPQQPSEGGGASPRRRRTAPPSSLSENFWTATASP